MKNQDFNHIRMEIHNPNSELAKLICSPSVDYVKKSKVCIYCCYEFPDRDASMVFQKIFLKGDRYSFQNIYINHNQLITLDSSYYSKISYKFVKSKNFKEQGQLLNNRLMVAVFSVSKTTADDKIKNIITRDRWGDSIRNIK